MVYGEKKMRLQLIIEFVIRMMDVSISAMETGFSSGITMAKTLSGLR